MEEIIIEVEQIQYSTKFAVLDTLEAYQALNNAIGTAKSYPDERSDTMNYSDPEPTAIDGIFYMQITPEVQEKYPSTLNGIVLIDSIPVEVIEDNNEII